MADHHHTNLCAHLSAWYVGDCDSDEFYGVFNLVTCDYVKFLFKEMKHIFFPERMQQWCSVLKGSHHDSLAFAITLVSFKPNPSNKVDERKIYAHN